MQCSKWTAEKLLSKIKTSAWNVAPVKGIALKMRSMSDPVWDVQPVLSMDYYAELNQPAIAQDQEAVAASTVVPWFRG